MTDFTIADYDANTLGTSNYSSIRCKVKGYWSSDTITLYIRRGYGKGPQWSTQISYGSGGRDTKEVESDTEAVRYFASALTAMADLADKIEGMSDLLEANYRAEVERYREIERKEREVREAAIASDAPLGEERAKELIGQLLSKGMGTANLFDRGSDRARPVSVVTRGKTTFYLNGGRIAKNNLIAALSCASARSGLVGVA